jgi:hypothetical protein
MRLALNAGRLLAAGQYSSTGVRQLAHDEFAKAWSVPSAVGALKGKASTGGRN